MFISTQSRCNAVAPLPPQRFGGSAKLDLETLLAQGDRLKGAVIDLETREQILQSLVMRMRQVRYLRRLPVGNLSQKFRY
ncbi:MAG: hypothetical protein VKL20_03175 [Synechocystis sp.]|nr:hypothetical protein [Synechocystis sp.]